MLLSALLAAGIFAAPTPPQHIPNRAEAFIKNKLKLVHYKATSADLNGDDHPEIIVYADEPKYCGSGGCNLYILAPQHRTYRVLTKLTVSRLPIQVLSTSSHGWSDLGVQVAGGGIEPPYEARLRFDGQSYPRNPTAPPATRVGKVRGRVILE